MPAPRVNPWMVTIAVTVGTLMAMPTSAFAFNPQPDPPKVAVDVSVLSLTVSAQLPLWPPGPTRTLVVALFPPGPTTPPVAG